MKKNVLNTLGINASKDIPVEDIFDPAINKGNYGLDDSDVKKIKALKSFCISYNAEKPVNRRRFISNAQDALDEMYGIFRNLDHEEVWVMFLNKANRIIDKVQMCIGGLDETTIDKRRILKTALDLGASSLILFHNHPSGKSNPSAADSKHTSELRDVCNVFDINLVDHIIVCDTEYFSYADGTVNNVQDKKLSASPV